jgi:hypothetical protein
MVPTSSPSCPRCRIENPTQSWLRRNVLLVVVVVGVVVVAGILLMGRGETGSVDAIAAAPATTVYHAGDSTEIRTGPGPENAVAFVAEPGALLHVHGTGDSEWLPVASAESASDTAGFVQRDAARIGPPPNLLVIRHGITTREANRYVVGLARNTTDKTYSYAYIQLVELRAGQMLGVGGIASINNLGPHEYWEWNALLSADSADSYQIFDVNGTFASP